MRNAQLKPVYNVQLGVDSEYIVAADIFSDRNDVWTRVPFLKTIEERLGFKYPSITADSGYESEEAYEFLKENEQIPYIKPQTYEKWKKRSFKKDISKRENMIYDKGSDTYLCLAGKTLKQIYLKKQTSKSGYRSDVTVYECEGLQNALTKKSVQEPKETNDFMYPKTSLRKGRNLMKIS